MVLTVSWRWTAQGRSSSSRAGERVEVVLRWRTEDCGQLGVWGLRLAQKRGVFVALLPAAPVHHIACRGKAALTIQGPVPCCLTPTDLPIVFLLTRHYPCPPSTLAVAAARLCQAPLRLDPEAVLSGCGLEALQVVAFLGENYTRFMADEAMEEAAEAAAHLSDAGGWDCGWVGERGGQAGGGWQASIAGHRVGCKSAWMVRLGLMHRAPLMVCRAVCCALWCCCSLHVLLPQQRRSLCGLLG